MSSLTNQQSNTKSLTGLSDTYSTNIVCDTFEVSQQFTIDTGCVISLPANSIPDPALSTNVALKNGANVFTNTNTFSLVGNQVRIDDPANVGQSTISQTGNSLNISSVTNNASPQTSMVLSTRNTLNGGCVLLNGNSTILNLGTGSASTTIVSPTLNLSATSLVYPAGGTAITGGTLTKTNTQINNGAITNNSTVLFNGVSTFALSGGQIQVNGGARFNDITGGTSASSLTQNGIAFSIANVHSSGSIRLNTKNSGGIGQDNVYALNGNQGGLQGASGNTIDITGTQATIGGTSVPVITTQPASGSNTNEISSTAWVINKGYATTASLSAYASLAGTQTFTGTNTFALSGNEVEFNGGCKFNDILLGPSSTIINQSGVVCSVANTHDLGSVTLQTRSSLGVPRDNVYALNGNQGGLRGNSGNTIDITGTQATIGGTSVPVITTQPSAVSNSNEIASTAFVINKGYATTASLSAYALLTANQTFTGTQTCVAANNVLPVKIQTQLVGYTGYFGGSLITDAGAYNGVNLSAGNYSVIAFGTGINTGGVLTLTTHSSTNCGIKITNTDISQTVPFTCGYLQLGTPVTSKTNYQLGFINTILYAGFTGNAWATSSGTYNIMSIVWNGTGDYTLGVWQVEIVIISQCTSAPAISFVWTTLSATSMSLNLHSGHVGDMGAYAGVGASIFRMSFVLNVTDILKSYFLNCTRTGGAGLSSDANSYIKFTRLA